MSRYFIGVTLLCHLSVEAADRPLPNAQELKPRVLASMKKSEHDLENYSCLVRTESEEFNGNGSVKKHDTKQEERFYVNGVPIGHLLVKDGKPLTGSEAKKEQERVNYEVRKYSDPENAAKRHEQGERQVDMFLRAQRLLHGKREVRNGRSTLVYDLEGDPGFHPKKLEERFAQALAGKLWLDEESTSPVELRGYTEKDIKIGGGLIANLHKGFQIHLLQQREPDGTWITKSIEGDGEARAVLFLHPRFHFREDLSNCHRFAVDTRQTVGAPEDNGKR